MEFRDKDTETTLVHDPSVRSQTITAYISHNSTRSDPERVRPRRVYAVKSGRFDCNESRASLDLTVRRRLASPHTAQTWAAAEGGPPSSYTVSGRGLHRAQISNTNLKTLFVTSRTCPKTPLCAFPSLNMTTGAVVLVRLAVISVAGRWRRIDYTARGRACARQCCLCFYLEMSYIQIQR